MPRLTAVEWKDRLDRAHDARRTLNSVHREAEQWDKGQPDFANIGIDPEHAFHGNNFAGIKRSKVSSLAAFSPRPRVEARTAAAIESAPVMQAMMQSEIRRLHIAEQLRNQIPQAFVGFGCWKVAFAEKPDEVMQAEAELLEQDAVIADFEIQLEQAAILNDMQSPDALRQAIAEVALQKAKTIQRLQTFQSQFFVGIQGYELGRIYVEQISYKDILWDPNAQQSIYNAEWIAHRKMYTMNELRSSTGWRNIKALEASRVQPKDDPYEDPGSDVDRAGTDEDDPGGHGSDHHSHTRDWPVEVYEIWDRRTYKVYTIAPKVGDVGLMVRDTISWPTPEIGNRFPFCFLEFGVESNSAIKQPAFAFYASLLELGVFLKSKLAQFAKDAARTTVVHEEDFEDEDLDDFFNGFSGALRMKRESKQARDMKNSIFDLPPPPTRTDVIQVAAMVDEELRVLSGVTEYQQGGAPVNVSTATEANAITQFAGAQAAYDQQQVDLFMRRTLQLIGMILEHRMPQSEVVKVVGQKGTQFQQIKDVQFIAGNYLYDIEPSGTGITAQAQKAKTILDMLLVIQRDPELNALVEKPELLKDLFRIVFDNAIHDPERYLKDADAVEPANLVLMMILSGEVIPPLPQEGENLVESFQHHMNLLQQLAQGEGEVGSAHEEVVRLLTERLQLLVRAMQELGMDVESLIGEQQATDDGEGQRFRAEPTSSGQMLQISGNGKPQEGVGGGGVRRERSTR